jgi:hypothetical protein
MAGYSAKKRVKLGVKQQNRKKHETSKHDRLEIGMRVLGSFARNSLHSDGSNLPFETH